MLSNILISNNKITSPWKKTTIILKMTDVKNVNGETSDRIKLHDKRILPMDIFFLHADMQPEYALDAENKLEK